MTQPLDPIKASDAIVADYRRYLRSLIPVRDPALAEALDVQLETTDSLAGGPFLEASPAYERGASLRALIDEGVLPRAFERFDPPALPLDRPLYSHQESATRKARAGRNLVVSTGTGSGKTESFLIPILASLADDIEAGRLGPGVRALLLYPMNALANDQMKRLRQVLAATPEITFGRYIGDTPQSRDEAERRFETLNPGEPRLPNELLSREEMQEAPPHLLLTNYAMLEYLLLRPEDMVIFEGGDTWKFVVVDEAHVYAGARGSELAMLVRRLRDRVGVTTLQAIATSATVGADSDPAAVTDFGEALFGVPFEWSPSDASKQDLVRARRVAVPDPSWGPLTPEDYRKLAAGEDLDAQIGGLPGHPDHASAYAALSSETTMCAVRSRLAGGTATVAALCGMLGPQWSPVDLADVITVGGRVTDGTGVPLLSARYHVWFRSTEGAFSCLAPAHPHVRVSRAERCDECDRPVFELAACTRCGTAYLVGSATDDEGVTFLRPRLRSNDRPTWLALGRAANAEDEDDAAFDEDAPDAADAVEVCADCGCISPQGTTSCRHCRGDALRSARQVASAARTPRGCVACGSRSAGQVRLLESGSDASASVLATSLYQNLPADTGAAAEYPGGGRKLLAFSDSRQGAAYFAPYLESTYGRLFRRRLLLLGMELACAAEGGPARLSDVVAHVVSVGSSAGVFEPRATRQQKEREVALWLAVELVASDDRQSLEGLGLVSLALDGLRDVTAHPVWSSLGLTPTQGAGLVAELLRTIRRNGAVAFADDVDPRDEAFAPRLGPIYVRESQSQPKVLSWLPTKGNNRRLDLVRRVLERAGSDKDPREVLAGIWRLLTPVPDRWLKRSNVARLGTVFQIDHDWVTVAVNGGDSPVLRCDVCQAIAGNDVLGVCPTMGCPGTVAPEPLPTGNADRSHFRRIYRGLSPIPLSVKEHTAQWRADEAAEIQNRFVRGELNALSCSTTFELGVDVGELQAVLLRNVPPTTANYVQRAGRAGRRTSSSALVVTLAQRRNHDLSFFARPSDMINGVVRPPAIPLGNERIDRRHAHSIALASFFRHAFAHGGHRWRTVGSLFRPEPGEPDPLVMLRHFLTPPPESVISSLRNVLPAEVLDELALPTSGWVTDLLDHLETVRLEVDQEVSYFEEACAKAASEKKYKLAEQHQRVVRTLTLRDLLGFLGARNVLPKYGFPTDVVDLRTNTAATAIGNQLELSRDLSQAIYEYAPGAQIVAGGLVWTSAGVYRLPERDLVHGFFTECKECNQFESAHEELPPTCPQCASERRILRYAVPEFGFIAEASPSKPGSNPPSTSWHGDTYYVSPGVDTDLPSSTSTRIRRGGWRLKSRKRARMMAVSTSVTGQGFFLCDWCGRGLPTNSRPPKRHRHAWKDQECCGPLQRRALAHTYETDVLEVDLGPQAAAPAGAHRSLLYAILGATADVLGIARDDIDGTLMYTGGHPSLVLFDTVPGGAGCVLQIPDRFDEIMARAAKRVSDCECGLETSCYSCLRSFRNQKYHDQLSREGALTLIPS